VGGLPCPHSIGTKSCRAAAVRSGPSACESSSGSIPHDHQNFSPGLLSAVRRHAGQVEKTADATPHCRGAGATAPLRAERKAATGHAGNDRALDDIVASGWLLRWLHGCSSCRLAVGIREICV
jgi:hypothetical protein